MSEKQEYCKITLSQNERIKLDFFLTMTTNYRQNELKTWQELAKEKNEDNTMKYPNAPGNEKWWNDLCNTIPHIKDALKNYECIEEKTKSIDTNEENDIDICN